jgi:hypothetical protein
MHVGQLKPECLDDRDRLRRSRTVTAVVRCMQVNA